MTNERSIKDTIRLFVGALPTVRLFTNPCGVAYVGAPQWTSGRVMLTKPRMIHFGLQDGSADLIGWRSVVITPEMVGKTVAQFVSIETKKSKGGKATNEQMQWRNVVHAHGGLAVIVNSLDEVKNALEEKI